MVGEESISMGKIIVWLCRKRVRGYTMVVMAMIGVDLRLMIIGKEEEVT